jgi:hypothetical protein
LWASSHTLRLADGLDEAYKVVVAKLELRKERKGNLFTKEIERE